MFVSGDRGLCSFNVPATASAEKHTAIMHMRRLGPVYAPWPISLLKIVSERIVKATAILQFNCGASKWKRRQLGIGHLNNQDYYRRSCFGIEGAAIGLTPSQSSW